MAHNKSKIVVTLALAGVAMAAHAQIRPAYQYPGAPTAGGIRLGDSAFFLTPYIGFALAHDDNLFQSSTNEKSSTLFITSPGFKIEARRPSSVLQLSYQGQFGHYTASDPDDYIDHVGRAQLDMAFGPRAFLRLGYDMIRSHDPRGSTDRPISTLPDKYRINAPNATVAFGAPGAQGRVEAYAGETKKWYLNNRETTAASDRTTTDYGAAFYWRVMPRTYVLAEVRQTEIDYKLPSPVSGEEQRYYAGVSWEATAATTGTLKVGQLKRKFDGPIPSADATTWEGIINWAPRTYSTFEFYTSRQTNESTGLGNFILSEVYGVAWTHAWSSVLSTGVNARFQKDDYQGFNRNDEIMSLGLRVGYRFRRWLTLGAEWNYTHRDSNFNSFEYDKNLYMLTATASM